MQAKLGTLYPFQRGFSMPKGDMNGMCNNFNTPLFMQNSETECTQSFKLADDCQNLMNPLFWSTQLSIQNGQAQNSQYTSVQTSALYTYSQATNAYTLVSDPTTLS